MDSMHVASLLEAARQLCLSVVTLSLATMTSAAFYRVTYWLAKHRSAAMRYLLGNSAAAAPALAALFARRFDAATAQYELYIGRDDAEWGECYGKGGIE